MKALFNILLACCLLVFTLWFLITQPILLKPSTLENPINKDEVYHLESHVRTLSEDIPNRTSPDSRLDSTVEWIENQLETYAKSSRQTYKVKDEEFHNILVNFEPTKPNASDELIIIGAHYDTAHGFAGADDNASGVAALIELAKLLSKNTNALGSRVQLAFYALEEPPYFRTEAMGSYVHATSLKQSNEKVRLMISLDMIGYFSDIENSQQFPFPIMKKLYSDKGNFIAIIGDLSNIFSVREVKSSFLSASDLPVYSINAPTIITGIDFSDHLNFWHYGYPAVMITDTSFNRNLNYHTEHDTADKLNYEKMAKVLKGVYRTVIDLSQP